MQNHFFEIINKELDLDANVLFLLIDPDSDIDKSKCFWFMSFS